MLNRGRLRPGVRCRVTSQDWGNRVGVYLATQRLCLRAFTDDDLEELIALDTDPEFMRYITDGRAADPRYVRDCVLPRVLQSTCEDFGYWVATDKRSGEFLGWFHFYPRRETRAEVELGYRLKRSAWGARLRNRRSQGAHRQGVFASGGATYFFGYHGE